MIKVILCDLDETLLSSDSTIHSRNIEAIKQATALGIKFVPCSGRGYNDYLNVVKTLDLYQKENEYCISFNGSIISENSNYRIIYHDDIPFELAEQIYERGLHRDVTIHVYTDGLTYVHNLNDDEYQYIKKKIRFEEYRKEHILDLKDKTIVKFIYGNTHLDYLREIESDLSDLKSYLDISYSCERFMEINKKEVNKGTATRYLAEYLHIHPSEILAIGDNFNDLPMLKEAGIAAGVANSNPAMKQYCDYISENDNNHGGVGEIIEKFVLHPYLIG